MHLTQLNSIVCECNVCPAQYSFDRTQIIIICLELTVLDSTIVSWFYGVCKMKKDRKKNGAENALRCHRTAALHKCSRVKGRMWSTRRATILNKISFNAGSCRELRNIFAEHMRTNANEHGWWGHNPKEPSCPTHRLLFARAMHHETGIFYKEN